MVSTPPISPVSHLLKSTHQQPSYGTELEKNPGHTYPKSMPPKEATAVSKYALRWRWTSCHIVGLACTEATWPVVEAWDMMSGVSSVGATVARREEDEAEDEDALSGGRARAPFCRLLCMGHENLKQGVDPG